jgi:hypothetical protein
MEREGKVSWEPPSSLDLLILERQFGRKPRDVIGIYKRCERKKPQAILTKPFFSGKIPFPSITWLTCPFLVEKVSQLEAKGLISELEKGLAVKKEFRESFLKAQKSFMKLKRSLLKGERHPLQNDLLKKGIAGVSELTQVKCLHAQLAFYFWSEENPVGEIVYNLVGEGKECKKDCGVEVESGSYRYRHKFGASSSG